MNLSLIKSATTGRTLNCTPKNGQIKSFEENKKGELLQQIKN